MNTSLLGAALAGLLLAACTPAAGDRTPEATPSADSTGASAAVRPEDAVSTPSTPAGDDTVNAAIDRVLGNHAQYQAMVKAYQKAVAEGDKAAVAALVNYPLAVTLDGKQTSIPDAMAFVGHYDQIVTPAIASVIKAQKYPELMVSGKGVMFGNGETWINGICRPDSADCSEFDVKVVAIQPAG
jgi:hypothetical protein